MGSLTIVTLLPELLDINGDAGNARVLSVRARWAGLDVAEIALAAGSAFPAAASAIVVGSSSDADLPRVIESLALWRDGLSAAIDAGVPVLAIGTGWEALASRMEMGDGTFLEGLGLIPGRSVPVPQRLSGELVVDSEFGRLVGYQNQSRVTQVPEDVRALGTARFGSGNAGSRGEGLRIGSILATRMHGPLLAKNPAVADHLLEAAARIAGSTYARDDEAETVDDYAAAARQRILTKLDVTD